MKNIIIVILLVVLVGGGIWFLLNSAPEPEELIIPEEMTEEETELPEEDETASWQSYSNKKYNYEFEYPENYRIASSIMEEKALKDITIREEYRKEYSIEDLVVITNLSTEEEQEYLKVCEDFYGGCYAETNFPPGAISLRPFFTADRDIETEVKKHESLTEDEKYQAAFYLSNFRTEETIFGLKVQRWRLNWTMQGKNYEMASISLPEKFLYPPIYHGDTDPQYLDEIIIRMKISGNYEKDLFVLDKILSTFRFLD